MARTMRCGIYRRTHGGALVLVAVRYEDNSRRDLPAKLFSGEVLHNYSVLPSGEVHEAIEYPTEQLADLEAFLETAAGTEGELKTEIAGL